MDDDSIITLPPDNSTHDICTEIWIGDGNCDSINNKADCQYDGGDCCRETCLKNCEASSCTYECGEQNRYNCTYPNAKCNSCKNGVCNMMNNCLLSTIRILTMIDSCYMEPWSQGNYSTSNYFCGKTDSDQTDTGNFKINQCTTRACCDDLSANKITSSNCDDVTLMTFIINDPLTLEQTEVKDITCIKFASDCFRENMKYRGQCCECDKGWIGYDCGTPICNPPCIHGTCVDYNTCTCENENWIGEFCNIPICAKPCVNGVCTNEDHCECFYGYTGDVCDIRNLKL